MTVSGKKMRSRLVFVYLIVVVTGLESWIRCSPPLATVQAAFLSATNDSRSRNNRRVLSTGTDTGAGSVSRRDQRKTNPPSCPTSLFAGDDSNEKQRQPWDVLRFVRQSSRFVSPFPGTRSKPKSSLAEDRRGTIAPGTTLWKAGQSRTNDFEFAPLDDVVMGGASSSTFDGATGKWTGRVTDANNGGFVGIRSTPLVDYDLSACEGIEWVLSGTTGTTERDKRLKVVLRDSADFNGIGWTTSRDTAATTVPFPSFGSSGSGGRSPVVLKIPFFGGNGSNNDMDSLVPSRFAKILTDAPPFASSSVKAFQLTYSKFEYDGGLNPKFYVGDFSIQLLEIRTY